MPLHLIGVPRSLLINIASRLIYRLSASKDCESVLKHQPYIDSLPNELWTPLFWTEEELRMLDGTNLRGATQDRKDTWLGSWNRSSEWVQSVQSEWRQDFTW